MIHAALMGFSEAWWEFKISVGNITPILESCARDDVRYYGTEISYSDLTLSAHYQQAFTEGSFSPLAEHHCEEKCRGKIIA